MKFNRLTLFIFLSSGALIFLFTESCVEKGCTDKSAINFNISATKNDGSCISCDSTLTESAPVYIYLYDHNTTSAHFNEAVAKFILVQKSINYNSSSCGNPKCKILYTMENLLNQDFDVSFSLESFGNVSFDFNKNYFTISAYQSVEMGEIPDSLLTNPCGVLNSGTLSVSAINLPIYYH